MDEVFGQLFNDIRIGACKFGIAFGIDMSGKNDFKKYNKLRHEDGLDIIYIIKEYPIKDSLNFSCGNLILNY